MAENATDQIVAKLRERAAEYCPGRGEPRNVRVVGHTPKNDHYTYDIVIDFQDGNERVSAKVYRPTKVGNQGAKDQATKEFKNLSYVLEVAQKRDLPGVPRLYGDFSQVGAVVTEKINGLPLQSIIMKAALLPGYADHGLLKAAARHAGEWLRVFHQATAAGQAPLDTTALLKEIEHLCESCKGEGLDDASIKMVLSGTRAILPKSRKSLAVSAVLNDFTPLNVMVCERGIGISDYAKMSMRGYSSGDVAYFLACVEALEKYPFCDRDLIGEVQEAFLEAYDPSSAEEQILRVMKMQALLKMFAQGRNVKESAVRKKVMWATVMKRFIHQAARRSMSPAA